MDKTGLNSLSMFPPGSKRLAVTLDITSTIGSVNSPTFTGTLHSTNFSSSQQCLNLLLACRGWVSIPIGSRLVSLGRLTQTAVDNLPGVLLGLGGRPLLSSTNITTRWEGRLTSLFAKLTYSFLGTSGSKGSLSHKAADS